jgi:hypothetical protein
MNLNHFVRSSFVLIEALPLISLDTLRETIDTILGIDDVPDEIRTEMSLDRCLERSFYAILTVYVVLN